MKKLFSLSILFFALAGNAADKVKIGFVSTLSGPNAAIGGDIRDAFNLAVKLNDGKLGGLPAEVLVGDDQLKPENAKQLVERFLRLEKVDFITGTVFSNVVVAIAPDVIAAKTFFIAPNAGPAAYSGAQCNAFFFVSSWPRACRRTSSSSCRCGAPTRTSSAPWASPCWASSASATGRSISTTRRTGNSSPSSRRSTSACRPATPRRDTTRRCSSTRRSAK